MTFMDGPMPVYLPSAGVVIYMKTGLEKMKLITPKTLKDLSQKTELDEFEIRQIDDMAKIDEEDAAQLYFNLKYKQEGRHY